MGAVFRDGDVAEYLNNVSESCGVVGYPCLRVALVLHQHRDHRRKQPRVGAGPNP